MKKVMYLSVLFMFSVFFANATTVTEENAKEKEVKTLKVEEQKDSFKDVIEFFTAYRGRCLDGHTFTFEADDREQGQDFVNAYCRARTAFNVEE